MRPHPELSEIEDARTSELKNENSFSAKNGNSEFWQQQWLQQIDLLKQKEENILQLKQIIEKQAQNLEFAVDDKVDLKLKTKEVPKRDRKNVRNRTSRLIN